MLDSHPIILFTGLMAGWIGNIKLLAGRLGVAGINMPESQIPSDHAPLSGVPEGHRSNAPCNA